jgi:hypothetical protein
MQARGVVGGAGVFEEREAGHRDGAYLSAAGAANAP